MHPCRTGRMGTPAERQRQSTCGLAGIASPPPVVSSPPPPVPLPAILGFPPPLPSLSPPSPPSPPLLPAAHLLFSVALAPAPELLCRLVPLLQHYLARVRQMPCHAAHRPQQWLEPPFSSQQHPPPPLAPPPFCSPRPSCPRLDHIPLHLCSSSRCRPSNQRYGGWITLTLWMVPQTQPSPPPSSAAAPPDRRQAIPAPQRPRHEHRRRGAK
mmetsp:Transcript_55255/g.139621  ORF Transcript_55255/g.139621 Transcript_55255/m.139621 type:complete len:212 (+) Transcript_55255:191-826(+)